MSVEKINQLYPLGAFMINELGLDITKDKLESLFKHLNVEFQPKIAELFCLNKEQVEEVYESVKSAPVSAAPVAVAGEEKKEEEKPKEEAAPAEDFDVFGDDDLFG